MSTRELPPELLEILLTTAEVAKVLKCGETKAKELVGPNGPIPSIKPAGLRRVRLRDLLDYLNGQPVDNQPNVESRAA
jgi:excisionase family DNA binding protein